MSGKAVVLDQLERIVQPIDAELYESMKDQALKRIALRDADDWPVLACAMSLVCPVWTEDADFFGTGKLLGPPTVLSCIWLSFAVNPKPILPLHLSDAEGKVCVPLLVA